MGAGDLAAAEGQTQPSMTAVVSQLQHLGLAERHRASAAPPAAGCRRKPAAKVRSGDLHDPGPSAGGLDAVASSAS
jgi:hypothetical protein